jgi:hypothetical protein
MMSFEYRELTAQVFLGAGEGAPCGGASCQGKTVDDEACIQCQTTLHCGPGTCATNTCKDDYDESPCEVASCREGTHNDCIQCQTTIPPCGGQTDENCVPCQTTLCQENTKPPGKYEYREALGLLRQQLRDTLAAG